MPTFEHVPHCEEVVRWMSPETGEEFRILKLDEDAALVQEIDNIELDLASAGTTTIPTRIEVEAEEGGDAVYVLQEALYPHFLQLVPEPVVKALTRNIHLVNAVREAQDRDARVVAVRTIIGGISFATVTKRT